MINNNQMGKADGGTVFPPQDVKKLRKRNRWILMLNYGKLSKILEDVFFWGVVVVRFMYHQQFGKPRSTKERERETKKKTPFKPDLLPDVYCPFEFLSTFSLRPLTTFYCCSLFQFSVFLKENISLCIFTK